MRYPWICNFGEKKPQVYSSGCFKTPGIDEKDLEDTNQEITMGLRNNLGLIPVVVRYIAFLSCSLGMYLFKVSLNRKTFDENFGEFFVGKIWNDFGKTRFHDTEKGPWYRERPMRRTLVKLRIGCHNLRVETGRYDKTPLEERICPLCTGNEIEDETHLLLDCQRYSSMRDIFLSKIETKIDEIRKLSRENLISQLMNSNDYYVNLRLIMFISSCFEMRNKLIWPLLEYFMNVMIRMS